MMNLQCFNRKYGKLIVSRYRRDAVKRFGKTFFAEINNYGTPLPVPKERGKRNSKMPTFWEFAQFVIDSKRCPQTIDIYLCLFLSLCCT